MKLDVIKLAQEVGAYRYMNRHFKEAPTHTFTLDKLERFAALVIEECAKVVDAAYEGAYRAQTAANIRSLKEPT